MTREQLILLLMPAIGLAFVVAFVFWQSWRDGVLPNQKPRKK
ncbi:hypothetical protein [Neorhizobium sp. LjRoot104]